jgi:hypothetical protein
MDGRGGVVFFVNFNSTFLPLPNDLHLNYQYTHHYIAILNFSKGDDPRRKSKAKSDKKKVSTSNCKLNKADHIIV